MEDPSPPALTTDTCDGKSCAIREFPASAFGPLRRAIARSKHPEQWREVGTNGPLDALLAEYAGHLCAACQAGLGEYERPQLDGLCEQALAASLEGLKGAEDVAAVLRSRLHRYGLAELVGDRTFEELRRATHENAGAAQRRRSATCLPPAFAQLRRWGGLRTRATAAGGEHGGQRTVSEEEPRRRMNGPGRDDRPDSGGNRVRDLSNRLGRKNESRDAAVGCGRGRRLCFWSVNVHRESAFGP